MELIMEEEENLRCCEGHGWHFNVSAICSWNC